ncbi:MAG: hypothetical protein ACERNK_15095, partial [Deltaproteobacteria bacterium]
ATGDGRRATGDEECATAFIERVGRRLFRRSLTGEELDARVAIASDAAFARSSLTCTRSGANWTCSPP